MMINDAPLCCACDPATHLSLSTLRLGGDDGREKQAFIVTQLEYVIVWLRTSFIYKRSKGQRSDPVGKDFEGWSSWSIMPRHFGLPNLKIAPFIGVVPNAQKRVLLQ